MAPFKGKKGAVQPPGNQKALKEPTKFNDAPNVGNSFSATTASVNLSNPSSRTPGNGEVNISKPAVESAAKGCRDAHYALNKSIG